jgi:hypothetical protein
MRKVLLATLLLTVVTNAQQRSGPREVNFKVVSAAVTRFDKPIRIGVGKRVTEYQEALVLKLEVNREEFDSLPPDIEPYLYIGTSEYRVYHIDRKDDRSNLILTFHVRDWQRLQEGALMVLTTEHGGPVRNPDKFRREGGVRFSKALITR